MFNSTNSLLSDMEFMEAKIKTLESTTDFLVKQISILSGMIGEIRGQLNELRKDDENV